MINPTPKEWNVIRNALRIHETQLDADQAGLAGTRDMFTIRAQLIDELQTTQELLEKLNAH